MCTTIIYPNIFSVVMDVRLISSGFYEVLRKYRLVHLTFWSGTIRYFGDQII